MGFSKNYHFVCICCNIHVIRRNAHMISKEELLETYNLTEEDFQAANISWEELTAIYDDFKRKRPIYEIARSSFLYEFLEDTDAAGIHSFRSRIKDPEHLIVKIIRKRNEAYKKYKYLTKDNYEHFLTDLIGFRVFILFKEDWADFHTYITSRITNDKHNYISSWTEECPSDNCFIEAPKVHIRTGDKRDIYQKFIHDADIYTNKIYRSVHYTIKYRGIYLEIQLRTLFEESWGEIDHKIAYPYYQHNENLNEFSAMINRLSGLADEMGSFFRKVKEREIEHLEHQKEASENETAPTDMAYLDDAKEQVCSEPLTPADMLHTLLHE